MPQWKLSTSNPSWQESNMKLLSKALLPLLVTSFCLGLNSCTDDKSSEEETPVVGQRMVTLMKGMANSYFDLKVVRELFSDDTSNEYKFYVESTVLGKPKRLENVNISIKATIGYKYHAEDKDIGKNEDFYFSYTQRRAVIHTETVTLTLPVPYNELITLLTSASIVDASGFIFHE